MRISNLIGDKGARRYDLVSVAGGDGYAADVSSIGSA